MRVCVIDVADRPAVRPDNRIGPHEIYAIDGLVEDDALAFCINNAGDITGAIVYVVVPVDGDGVETSIAQ